VQDDRAFGLLRIGPFKRESLLKMLREPNPNLVKADTVTECPDCRASLDQPALTKHRIIEELPNAEPPKVVDYREDHYRFGSGIKL